MSKIPWTELTWNPIVGCSKISAGCQNCYAEKMASRLVSMGQVEYMPTIFTSKWTGKTAFVESALRKPLHWKKPKMIFVCSMGDLFHESVPFKWIDKVYSVMLNCPQHTWQVLTKRPERMLEYYKTKTHVVKEADNIWLGVTAENQEMANERIPILLQIPAAVRFVSCEPMLEPVDLTNVLFPTGFHENVLDTTVSDRAKKAGIDKLNGIDWVIVGCESGSNRRICSLHWVANIAYQCNAAGVPCFVKQIGQNGKLIKNPSGWPRGFPKASEQILAGGEVIEVNE